MVDIAVNRICIKTDVRSRKHGKGFKSSLDR